MNGWIIAGIVLALLAAPLFIPLIARARWDADHLEWSVQVGPFTVAPDTRRHMARYRRTLKNVARPFVWLGRGLGFVLRWLVIGLVWLARIVTWPVRAPLSALKRRRQTRREARWHDREMPAWDEQRREESAPAREAGPSPADDWRITATGEDDSEGEEAPGGMDAPGSSPGEGHDTGAGFHAEEDFDLFGEDVDAGERESFERIDGQRRRDGEGKRKRSPGQRIEQLQQRWGEIREMVDRFGRPGLRTLRAAILLGVESLRTLHWRRFEGYVRAGGDPATLGAIQGWKSAVLGTVDPRLNRHLVFDPDYDDVELAPTGTLDVVLVVWPYRFVLPTLRFIGRVPWLTWFKVVRAQMRK